MKHIERRFLNQMDLPKKEGEPPLHELLGSKEVTSEMMNNAVIPPDFIPWLMSDDKFFSAFQAVIDGKRRIIPEPDTILVYYSTAYWNYKALATARKKVIDKIDVGIGGEPAIDELYEYFGLVSCIVIFLFMTVEGTMNRSIPDDYVLTNEGLNKTEVFNKAQIERNFPFDRKLNVLNKITQKDFQKNHSKAYEHIMSLKNFRDAIIHTKSENEGDLAINHNLRRAFDYDFESAMFAVRDFCNYYLKPNFIVDCPCSKDW